MTLVLVAACGPARSLVIEHVAVVDVVQGRIERDRDVELADGVIARIGPATGGHVNALDGTGRYLVPGFIDMHAHVLLHPWDEAGRITPAIDRAASLEILKALLASGVTTVRDPGAQTEDAVALRAQLAGGAARGPRLITAGRMLDPRALSAEPFVRVSTEADVRAEIDRQVAAGVDWIKLYAGLPADLAAVAIAVGHRAGLRIAGHLAATSWTQAAQLGIDTIEHPAPWSASYLPEAARVGLPGDLFGRAYWLAHVELDGAPIHELIGELVRHRVTVVPTLIAMHTKFWGDDPRYTASASLAQAPAAFVRGWPHASFTASWTPEQYAAARATWPTLLDFIRRLHDAGVALAIGTDTPTPWIVPGVSFHQELQLLREAGISPADLLRMATIIGARALGLDGEIGTIAVGKRADLVLLSANPLDDIANTAAIVHVIQRGRIVR